MFCKKQEQSLNALKSKTKKQDSAKFYNSAIFNKVLQDFTYETQSLVFTKCSVHMYYPSLSLNISVL